MKIKPSELKQARDRLSRVQGQINGIIKMIDEGRDCDELLTQLAAANTALQRAGFTVVSLAMNKCAKEPADSPNRKALEKAFMSLV
jgi:DNA-binding FrmR family transcriptional regulator